MKNTLFIPTVLIPVIAGFFLAQYLNAHLWAPLAVRTAELKNTKLFEQRGSGLPLLEAETALLALEWPLLGQVAQNARLDNLEALVRVSR